MNIKELTEEEFKSMPFYRGEFLSFRNLTFEKMRFGQAFYLTTLNNAGAKLLVHKETILVDSFGGLWGCNEQAQLFKKAHSPCLHPSV